MENADDYILGRSADRSITYKRLTKDNLYEAITVLNKTFYHNEPLCTALEITKSPDAIDDLNQLFTGISQDEFSVVALDSFSNQVVGVCFNKLETKLDDGELDFYEVFKRKKCKENITKIFIDFFSESMTGIDLYDFYNTSSILDIVGLAVLPQYQRKGIGKDLMAHSLALLQSTKAASVAIVICSSAYTQYITKQLGFTVLYSLPYEECVFNGRKFSDVIKGHSVITLVGKNLAEVSN